MSCDNYICECNFLFFIALPCNLGKATFCTAQCGFSFFSDDVSSANRFLLVAYGRQCYICSDFQKIHNPLLNFYKCYQSKYSSRLLWQQNENSPSCSPFFLCVTLEHKGEGRWVSSCSTAVLSMPLWGLGTKQPPGAVLDNLRKV